MNHLNLDIESLGLNSSVASALRKAHLKDLSKILTLSNSDIKRLTGLSSDDISSVKTVIADTFLPYKPVKALDLLKEQADPALIHWKLSTGCPVIDNVLRGGLTSGILTEISGESASGKTQLCIQLCISVQLSRQTSAGAVYICTEDVFPSKRMQQLIQCHSSKVVGKNLGDNIFIEHAADFETLDLIVERKLPVLLNKGCVSVVIIDSITALFRCHYTASQTVERAKHLVRFASTLHSLASRHNIPIVCVNQVSANMQASSTMGDTIPALGLTWANQVASRLILHRAPFCESSNRSQKDVNLPGEKTTPSITWRKLTIAFAPNLPCIELPFFIDQAGVHGVNT